MDSNGINENLLTMLVGSGIINLAAIGNLKSMTEKEAYVNEVHSSKISKNSDGRWKTYVEVDGQRKLVAKTKKEKLIDYLYDFYTTKNQKQEQSFENAFRQYVEYKKQLVDDNTILRYEYDYKKYFEGTDFSRKSVKTLKKEDIEVFIVKTIREKKLRKKAYEGFYGYLKGTLQHMYNNDYIEKNPMDRMARKDYYRYCDNPPVDMERRIASDDDISKIKSKIHELRIINPKMITGYAVEFSILTGMRVGEIAALMWDRVDFNNKVITIDKAEIRNQKTKEYRIAQTKNHEIRYIPMTPAIEKLLREVWQKEDELGFLCAFVFANEKGQIHKSAISCYARNMSYQVGLNKPKSIHTFRRTINSKVRSQGLSAIAAASIFGHTEAVNEQYYTYDVSSMETKRQALAKAQPV